MSTDKYNITWNDFTSSVVESFQSFKSEDMFHDVCLLTQDDHIINAHRIILSSGSPFFKNVLGKMDTMKPMIYMKGYNNTEVLAAIDFIYQGETNVCQNNLDSFLALAEDLKLRGISRNNKISDDSNAETENVEEGTPTKELKSPTEHQ